MPRGLATSPNLGACVLDATSLEKGDSNMTTYDEIKDYEPTDDELTAIEHEPAPLDSFYEEM